MVASHRSSRRLFGIGLVALLFVATSALAGAGTEPVDGPHIGDDIDLPEPILLDGEVTAAMATVDADSLDLVAWPDVVRYHSLGTDTLEVWTCGIAASMSEILADLQHTADYYYHHSDGAYDIEFVAGGEYGGTNPDACLDHAAVNTAGTANGVVAIPPSPSGGGTLGVAGPGPWCTDVAGNKFPCPTGVLDPETYPENGRDAWVSWPFIFDVVAVHELGHMIHWPHTHTESGTSDYDVASDVMSRNAGSALPYDTAVFNRYAAGWIDPSDVYLSDGSGATIDLMASATDGTQMIVIEDGPGHFYVLGARVTHTYDPIPAAWEGVEVYEVTNLPSVNTIGFRTVQPVPDVPSQSIPTDQPLPHVLGTGDDIDLAGVTIEVDGSVTGGFSVTINGGPGSTSSTTTSSSSTSTPTSTSSTSSSSSSTTSTTTPPTTTTTIPPDSEQPRFIDTPGTVFEEDIDWIAKRGITRGCNPPDNTRFCPDDPVTRGQMAAFLARAFDLDSGAVSFDDTAGSVFAADIAALARAGITRGCNPPDNTRFCPDDPVTRGQMAAFLRRALS
jgi:hypothetical protein